MSLSKNISSNQRSAMTPGDWRAKMYHKNENLNRLRKAKYTVGENCIDDSHELWSYNIFDGYGCIIDNEEYLMISEGFGIKDVAETMLEAKSLYDKKNGSQYGIYYASNLIFDTSDENDDDGLQLLENESIFHRSKLGEDEESPSHYPASPTADFILGKYYSTRHKETALDYYNAAMGGSFGDNRKYAKKCFASSCLDLIENGIYDTEFLKSVSDVIHERESTTEFCINLDKRLEIKGHELSIEPKTWVDVQCEIILSEKKNVSDENLFMKNVWKRLDNHLKKENLSTDDVLNFVLNSNTNVAGREGYNITGSSYFISNLCVDDHIDMKTVNETFHKISENKDLEFKSLKGYYSTMIDNIIEGKKEKGKDLTDDDIYQITDYVGSGYGGRIEGGDSFAISILELDKKGLIDRNHLKSKLSTTNYALYREKLVSDYKNQSTYDVADSLLYLEREGDDRNRSFVDGFLRQHGPSKDDNTSNLFHFVSKALNDDKTSAENKRLLLKDYTEYLRKKDIKLGDEDQKELDKITTNITKDYIKEEAAAKNEDVLKTIDRLVFEGKLTVAEAKDIKMAMLQSGEIPITDTEMEPVEFKANGEKIKMDFTASGWYDKILNFSFKNNKSGAKEIVDVVSEYGWMNNTTNKNTSSDFIKHNNIPYCYAVEYRQLYNASISNIILSFLGLAYSAKGAASGVYNLAGSAIDGIINLSSPLIKMLSGGSGEDNSNKSTTLTPQDGGQTTEEKNTSEGKDSWLDKAGRMINSWANEGDKYFRSAMEKVAYLDSRGPIATGRKSGLLNPYRMMYILSKTDKQYCFPMLDKSASSYKVANKMDEADGGQGSSLLGNRFFGMVANLAQTVLGIAQDINQIAPFFQSAIGNGDNIKSMRQYHIERSKFFSFPTDGEDIEVSFILFNTVKKNIWKKHFNFIFGFVLRNLPFKHDLVSYYPPLFYDVIVPGVKRCPYCYVERIDVSPLGLMRNMSMSSEDIGLPNLTNGGGKMNYTVNVPEAWQVKIVFKSLIATSGNQILSGFVDMPIQASSSNDSLKNKNENKK